MPDRAGEDADRPGCGDDAALRSLSGAAPCGRKEGGHDGGRVGRGGGRDRRRGRGGFAIAESADKAADQAIIWCCGLQAHALTRVL